jgi:hypothetical protein
MTLAHLNRILSRCTEILSDEVLKSVAMSQLYPAIGRIHPALSRKAHVQHLLFAGLRQSGYFVLAEENYFVPASKSRQIDLAIWLPDSRVWLYLEIEPCWPLYGYQPVLVDAQKLTNTTRRSPPAGRQVARKVWYRFRVASPYRGNVPVCYPRRCPARLAKSGDSIIIERSNSGGYDAVVSPSMHTVCR